ncbi:FxSxx-COOH system tetratricopeptide repeat protein [Thermopolyspora sp. NPDC052614]|uniref:FxSxx-COOH system tetratricopeptide repeat protein n=1 Tax=Thermopolyspora sp. NPDC052614 TaxID=3155682 RepID=UPI003412DAA5
MPPCGGIQGLVYGPLASLVRRLGVPGSETNSGLPPRLTAPVVWGNVPQRNTNFTGRSDLLRQLRRRLDSEVTALLPHALQGLGGVGKTQLAIEYIYRHSHDYQVVWWVPADQPALMRSSLAALAPRLGITGIAPGRVEDAIEAVRDALRRGVPYDRWLLVFDNADQPEELHELIPHGPGHVLITSRNHRWQSRADTLEVNVFPRNESLEFLERRVPGISREEADRLAEKLGDLPLALEQAGALMAETAMTVGVYLERLDVEAGKILAQGTPLDYPVPVAAAWSMSVARLREQMPHAMELLYRCAYFGPEPIPLDLILLGRHVLGPSPLRDTIKDPYRMSEAVRELGRYALARIDNHRRTLQMHRIIQTLIREDLAPEQRAVCRRDVHLLLAAADPDRPDDVEKWPEYDDLVAHVGPAAIVESEDPEVRRLAANVVRYLLVTGDLDACQESADLALEHWARVSGPDDLYLLVMSRHKVNLLHTQGLYRQAFELSDATRERLEASYGPEHDETLLMNNMHGGILRALGDFTGALALDESTLARHRRVFGAHHPNTFRVANNLALDYVLLGRYEDALRLDEQGYRERRDYYGSDDNWRVVYALNAISRDLRLVGRYLEARDRSERAYVTYQEIVRQRLLDENHPDVLSQARELSAARRKAGAYAEAFDLGQEVYDRYRRAYGENHPNSLAAAVNLANAHRLMRDYPSSAALLRETINRYARVLGPDHPFVHASRNNLAIALRLLGDPAAARDMLEAARESLLRSLGEDHHYTLVCATNLASALAELGQVKDARQFDADGLDRCRVVLGETHPHTLACAANLALDEEAMGNTERAEELRARTLDALRRTLGDDYPDLRLVRQRVRIDLDFEPPPV